MPLARDLREASRISASDKRDAPGNSRSMMNFGVSSSILALSFTNPDGLRFSCAGPITAVRPCAYAADNALVPEYTSTALRAMWVTV
jgi:hypothetical protein